MRQLSHIESLVRRTLVSKMANRPVSTSSYAMVKAIEDLETNPYFEKYAGKIAKAQKANPEEFLKRHAQGKEIKESQPGGHAFSKVAEKPKEVLPKGAYSHVPTKVLDSIMKTDLLKDKTNEEIEYIWREHFRNKDAVSAVVPGTTYDKLHEKAMKYTSFVFPLPREKGYEFILAQFAGHEVHFTPLINYQAYKENAPECLTLVHYTDFKEERGIVLMHGEYDKNIINAFEAQNLVNQLQLYYSEADKEKSSLLEKFHKKPEEFKHMDLIEQLEKIDLSALATNSAEN